jgi:hypothetical protein
LDDGSACATDTCDGAGTCTHAAGKVDALCRPQTKGGDGMTPALPLDPPLRTQLSTAGTCWEATYPAAGIKRNDTLIVKVQSD